MRFKFHKATTSIEIDGSLKLTEQDMADLIAVWEKGMAPILKAREAKRQKQEEAERQRQLEKNQDRVTVQGEEWVIQRHPSEGNPIHAWPATYEGRHEAPFSVDLNASRIKRPYGVVVRRRLRGSGDVWPFLELGGYYYEDIESAIASTIKRRKDIERVVKAQKKA